MFVADRVHETTTTTGTGDITLAGAEAGFQTFNAAIGTAIEFTYCIYSATEWEVGYGELSDATTLVRTGVIASTNSDAAVNFSAGTKQVICTVHAGIFNYITTSAAADVAPSQKNNVDPNSTGVALGKSNAAAAYSSGAAIGQGARLHHKGQIALSGAYISAVGDTQALLTHLEVTTTNATPTFLGYTGSSAADFLITDTAAIHKVLIVAREGDTGDTKGWEVTFVEAVPNGGDGGTDLVGSATVTVIGASAGAAAWTVAVADGGANGAYIQVTGESSHTIHWTGVRISALATYLTAGE